MLNLILIVCAQIPDIYDCIKYDVQHNRTILEPGSVWDTAIQLYTYVKNLADVVIPQEYGMTKEEKLTIAQVKIEDFVEVSVTK